MISIFKKRVLFSLLLVGLIVLLWFQTTAWMKKGLLPAANGKHEYAIVLGAKVNGETPSLSLQYRLEAASKYAHEHPHVKLILSGGQGPREDISEAEAMKRFLIREGIDENRLLLESSSTSTYENITYSKKLLPVHIKGVTLITSDFHLGRARMLAESAGIETDSVAAKTPKVVEVKMRTWERLALLKTAVWGK